jgi:hypothetical protein
MKSWKSPAALFSLCLGFLTPPASAFTLLYSASQNLTVTGWGTDTVTFEIDSSCTSFLATVQAALSEAQSVWNGVPSARLSVALGATTSLPNAITYYINSGTVQNPAPSGNPVVYCDTQFQTHTGASASNIPGLATAQRINTVTGKLSGGLLILNFESGAAANVATVGAESAAYVLAHEIGHILGLGHSSSDAALMYYNASTGKDVRLSQDDIDGISYLYPREEPTNGGLLGCGTLSLVRAHGDLFPSPPTQKPTGPSRHEAKHPTETTSQLAGAAELLAVLVFANALRRRNHCTS